MVDNDTTNCSIGVGYGDGDNGLLLGLELGLPTAGSVTGHQITTIIIRILWRIGTTISKIEYSGAQIQIFDHNIKF